METAEKLDTGLSGRIPRALKQRLTTCATADHRNFNNYLNDFLLRYIAHEEKRLKIKPVAKPPQKK